MTMAQQETYWAHVDLERVPDMLTPAPGPKSNALHARCGKCFKGLSGQVKRFPVAFESGRGCELIDVDGKSVHRLLVRHLRYHARALRLQRRFGWSVKATAGQEIEH
jgi:hypothetical protein